MRGFIMNSLFYCAGKKVQYGEEENWSNHHFGRWCNIQESYAKNTEYSFTQEPVC